MTTNIRKRVALLEGNTTPPEQRDALLVIHGAGRHPEELIGVYGINVPRLANEPAEAFLRRLEGHVRATRGRALPLVLLAQYADDMD